MLLHVDVVIGLKNQLLAAENRYALQRLNISIIALL